MLAGNYSVLEKRREDSEEVAASHLTDLEQDLKAALARNSEKVKRLVVMRLHSTSLSQKLAKVMEEESKAMEQMRVENEELAFQLHMARKAREESEVCPAEEELLTFDFCFDECMEDVDNCSTYPSLAPPKAQEDPPSHFLSIDIEREPRKTSISDNLHLFRSDRSGFFKGSTPRTEERDEDAGDDFGQVEGEGFEEMSAEDRSDLAVKLLQNFVAGWKFKDSCLSREQVLEEMVVFYDCSMKAKDKVIFAYAKKLEETKEKLGGTETFKAKQKSLLKKKEEEILYLVEALKDLKGEQMGLIEKYNDALMLLSSKAKGK